MMLTKVNTFKDRPHLKAERLSRPSPNLITHAALLAILTLTQGFLFCVCSRACTEDKSTSKSITHLPFTASPTRREFLFKRHPHSLCTLPLQSHLNHVHINHCHRPAYSWPSMSNTGQRWRRGNIQRRVWKEFKGSTRRTWEEIFCSPYPSSVKFYTYLSMLAVVSQTALKIRSTSGRLSDSIYKALTGMTCEGPD